MIILKNACTRKNFLLSVLSFLFTPISLFANKSSVELEVPKSARKKSIINIKVKVIHKGNSFFHYTNLLIIKINDEILKMWEFTAFKRPEKEVFSREIVYTITGPTKVTAEAHCNLHGSTGERSVELKIY